MKRYLLQRIVMPESKDKTCRDLFLRWGVIECKGFGTNVASQEEMHFNTWMNLFAGKKWFHYAQLGKLFLGVNIKGTFSIEVIGSNRNTAYNRIDEQLFFQEYSSNGEAIYIEINKAEEYDAVYLILRYLKNAPCEVISLGWYTDLEPQRVNRLAIVTCTFKRENYIHRTMQQFEAYLTENVELRERMHLFVIDNGQTLDLEKKSPYINIFYNMNAGGAGGFGRGLIEACRADEDYTRCLFIDDDVDILPESFYRTLILADYLKGEYSYALINGAMLDLYNKVIFHENLAVQDGLWCHPYHGETNLLNYDDILRVNDIPEEEFHKEYPKTNGAWFYCSFAINGRETINELPLPIFIRGDDVEYGYRNFGNVFIQLNGICIWHAPFYYRVNKITDSYYLCRNMFIVNTLYTPNFKNTFARMYRERFRYAIATYDYVTAQLINKALQDILKGSRLFEESPLDIMGSLNTLAKEESTPVNDPYELLEIRHKVIGWPKYRRVINKAIKGCFKLAPVTKCLIKRNGMNTAPEWFPPADIFLMKKQVKVYNLLKHTSTVRSFNYKRERELKKEFEYSLGCVQKNFDSLAKDYKDNFKKLTSYEFWKKYLKLT